MKRTTQTHQAIFGATLRARALLSWTWVPRLCGNSPHRDFPPISPLLASGICFGANPRLQADKSPWVGHARAR